MPVPSAQRPDVSNPPPADVLAIMQAQQVSELRATQRSAEGSRLLEGASDASRQLMLFVRTTSGTAARMLPKFAIGSEECQCGRGTNCGGYHTVAQATSGGICVPLSVRLQGQSLETVMARSLSCLKYHRHAFAGYESCS